MSTKVKNIFSAKNLTQIFLGMAIIAVAGLNVKLAMRSQDWSFLSLMNIESLGLTTAENTKKDSVKFEGPSAPMEVKCTHTVTITTTSGGNETSKTDSGSNTSSTTQSSKEWNAGANVGVVSGGVKGGTGSNTGSNTSSTSTTSKNTSGTSTKTETTTTTYTLTGRKCTHEKDTVCTAYVPLCNAGDTEVKDK